VHFAVKDEKKAGPFPAWHVHLPARWRARLPQKWRADCDDDEALKTNQILRLVAAVADSYPRLLAWLTEGRVSSYWNVFGILISLVRVIPVARRLVWLIIFKPVARHAPWRFALRDVLLQEERSEVNGILGNRTNQSLRISGDTREHGTQGLSAVTDVTMIAQTAARDALRKKVENMSSGCIGVSGLTGSGKTTLIRDFCRHRYGTPVWKGTEEDKKASERDQKAGQPKELPGLRFTVQAPLRYNAMEFLIHQYTCLCETVLADQRLNPTSFLHRFVISVFVPRSIRVGALLRALTGIALAGITVELLYRATGHNWLILFWLKHHWAWPAGVAALLAFLAIVTSPTRRALAEVRQIITLSADAKDRLERLHYQRTDTRGGEAALSGLLGSNVKFSSTHAFTEQMMTLPELIHDYRDFAERIVAALQQAIRTDKNWRRWHDVPTCDVAGAGNNGGSAPDKEPTNIDVRLVIGIDEMDRIEDTQKADEFLAELSSVFGTPYCVYLISISPGAIATSDQRLIPSKIASSGIFDDMVWVDALDLPTADCLLDQRVIGLPVVFTTLCYVLSGGLPRDLLRIARNIFPAEDGDLASTGIADVTRKVIDDEFRTLKHRALANAADLQIPATGDLLRLLSPDHRPESHAGAPGLSTGSFDFKTAMNAFSELWAGEERDRFADMDMKIAPLTAEVCNSYLASLYFLSAVYWLFTTESSRVIELATPEPPKDGERSEPGRVGELRDNKILRNLARARLALGVDPYMAAKLISETMGVLPCHDHDLFPGADVPPFLNPAARP
jgi:hypothetical protein